MRHVKTPSENDLEISLWKFQGAPRLSRVQGDRLQDAGRGPVAGGLEVWRRGVTSVDDILARRGLVCTSVRPDS